jgi:hypothetical protein
MNRSLAVLSIVAAGTAAALAQRSRMLETPKPEPMRSSSRWKLQFFHDKADSVLDIVDLKFPSATRGVALGRIIEKGHAKETVLVTSNGGEKWDYIPIQEAGLSLFFLNEQDGWMVTNRGIWKTEEAGRNWRKLGNLKGANHVFFTSALRGFAVGYPKAIWETADGGKNWKKVEAAAKPSSTPQYTVYNVVQFANQTAGFIAGSSKPPRITTQPEFPAWMDPEGARRQWPSLLILLQTRDGGANWNSQTVSIFGSLTRMSLASDGRGLGLLEFLDKFDYPSEVFSVNLQGQSTTTVFRRKDRSVTDVAVVPDGPAYLAAIEPSGTR